MGDAKTPPTLLASPNFKGMAVIGVSTLSGLLVTPTSACLLDADPYIPGDHGAQWYTNQDNLSVLFRFKSGRRRAFWFNHISTPASVQYETLSLICDRCPRRLPLLAFTGKLLKPHLYSMSWLRCLPCLAIIIKVQFYSFISPHANGTDGDTLLGIFMENGRCYHSTISSIFPADVNEQAVDSWAVSCHYHRWNPCLWRTWT